MSSAPGAAGTVRLVNELREQLNAFAAREHSLTRSFENIASSAERSFESAVEEEQARYAVVQAQVQEEFSSRRAALEHWTTQRRARIRAACTTARRQRIERIEHRKGREIFGSQQGTIAANREKTEAVRAEAARRAAVLGRVEAARDSVLALMQSARSVFRGSGALGRELNAAQDASDLPDDAAALEAEFLAQEKKTTADLAQFGGRSGLVPAWMKAIQAAGTDAGRGAAREITGGIARLARLQARWAERANEEAQYESARIEAEAARQVEEFKMRWQRATSEAEESRTEVLAALEGVADRLEERHEALACARLAPLDEEFRARLDVIEKEHEEVLRQLAEARDDRADKLAGDNQARWIETEAEWAERIPSLFETVEAAVRAGAGFPAWESESWHEWSPPSRFAAGVPFGRIAVDLTALCESLPSSPRLPLPGPVQFDLPLMLAFPHEGSLLLDAPRGCAGPIADSLNAAILRLLAGSPAGRLNLTLLDPVGLGQNFAGVMHLADYEDSPINNRIWTQSAEIEQRLSDLNKHIEKVIQLNLRNEYATIQEYNEQAGNIAEKYHFLVVADFPANFSETAMRHLTNIAVSGARCGVYTLVHRDRRQPLAPGLALEELQKASVCLTESGGRWEITGLPAQGTRVELAKPPGPAESTELLHRVGESWKDSGRVEVPFSVIMPRPEERWTGNTADELRIPIGRAGATKLQEFALGRGTRQHVLIGGKTGSGKSTLFHVLVTNLALWCSPEEVEFYLVDFKKGVEFKCYATHRLPHARVVAIESDREFGLGVLRRVDEELKNRGDMFRKLGVQNLGAYRQAGGASLPRTLLLIDEFQEFFVEDDRIAQEANVLLDRIVRQGRAFGIHAVLGSQTLGGAYTLARATMGQMVVRIALQCNEADAQLIMDDNNPAPRFLTRPGEGIYNDMAGSVEGNSPFQTVWLSEEERDRHLAEVRLRAADRERPAPFVFEGNAPADVRENAPLAAVLARRPTQAPTGGRIWLGEPNSIKGPTEAVIQRQGGNNLLVVGQSEESLLALMGVGLISLAAQFPRDAARFFWLDSAAPGTPQEEFLRELVAAVPHGVTVARGAELSKVLGGLAGELRARESGPGPAIFVFIPALQGFKKLRQEEDFGFSSGDDEPSPARLLADLLAEGPAQGIHVIAGCDTYNNVMRFVGRKALTEFEMRVLFQMSANDSASLIDSPRAGALGLHRALLHNGQEGFIEIFRPYLLPDAGWLQESGQALGVQKL